MSKLVAQRPDRARYLALVETRRPSDPVRDDEKRALQEALRADGGEDKPSKDTKPRRKSNESV